MSDASSTQTAGSAPKDSNAEALKAATELAEKYKAEAKALKDAHAKRETDEKAKAKADADAKAIADGEAKRLLAEREGELVAERKARADLEEAHRGRIDRMIAKLPEAARGKLESIKGDLPLGKLELLVEAEAEQAAKISPAPSRTPGAAAGKEGAVKLSAEAQAMLESLNVDPKSMDGMTVVHDKVLNTTKFVMPIGAMIKKLAGMAPAKTRLSIEAYNKKYGKA